MSDPVNRPDLAGTWGGLFEAEKRRYMKDMQRRQIQTIELPYGTGINEGRRTRKPTFFH